MAVERYLQKKKLPVLEAKQSFYSTRTQQNLYPIPHQDCNSLVLID